MPTCDLDQLQWSGLSAVVPLNVDRKYIVSEYKLILN